MFLPGISGTANEHSCVIHLEAGIVDQDKAMERKFESITLDAFEDNKLRSAERWRAKIKSLTVIDRYLVKQSCNNYAHSGFDNWLVQYESRAGQHDFWQVSVHISVTTVLLSAGPLRARYCGKRCVDDGQVHSSTVMTVITDTNVDAASLTQIHQVWIVSDLPPRTDIMIPTCVLLRDVQFFPSRRSNMKSAITLNIKPTMTDKIGAENERKLMTAQVVIRSLGSGR